MYPSYSSGTYVPSSTHYGTYRSTSYPSYSTNTYSTTSSQTYGTYRPYYGTSGGTYGGSSGGAYGGSSGGTYGGSIGGAYGGATYSSPTYTSSSPSYSTPYYQSGTTTSYPQTVYSQPTTTTYAGSTQLVSSTEIVSAPSSDVTLYEGETTIASMNLNNDTLSQNNSATNVVIVSDDEDDSSTPAPKKPRHPTSAACIFCKIIQGTIPSYKVYSNDDVYCFLDINPVSKGHTLVVPKGHYETVSDLPSDVGAALGRALPRVAHAVASASGMPDHNIISNNGKKAGQEVPHVHFHIIPRAEDDKVKFKWPAGKLTSVEAAALLEDMAEELS